MPSYKTTQRWRTKARRWATEYAGNSCQNCGYNRYIGNLIFHHLDPKLKKEGVSVLINSTASWSIILAELDKCVLVCHNCHGEIHAGLISCPAINVEQRRITLLKLQSEITLPKTKQFHNCRCGERIPKTLSHCSQKCHHEALEKIKWPANLPELVKRSSKLAVSKRLGVSDKAVAARLLYHHKDLVPTVGFEPTTHSV